MTVDNRNEEDDMNSEVLLNGFSSKNVSILEQLRKNKKM